MFEFLVEFYDEITDGNTTTKGFTPAANLSEAAQNISNYYGEDNISNLTLKYISDHPILEFPEDMNIETVASFNYI